MNTFVLFEISIHLLALLNEVHECIMSVESPVNFPVLIGVNFLISFEIPIVSSSSSYNPMLGGRETDKFSVIETAKIFIYYSGNSSDVLG